MKKNIIVIVVMIVLSISYFSGFIDVELRRHLALIRNNYIKNDYQLTRQRSIRTPSGKQQWTGWDLNPRPPPCEGGDLPLIYQPLDEKCKQN